MWSPFKKMKFAFLLFFSFVVSETYILPAKSRDGNKLRVQDVIVSQIGVSTATACLQRGSSCVQSKALKLAQGDINRGLWEAEFDSSLETDKVIVEVTDLEGMKLGDSSNLDLTGESEIVSAVIDTLNGYAYFGTETTPGKVIKVSLGSGSALPTRIGTLTLDTRENDLYTAVIDPSNGCLLWDRHLFWEGYQDFFGLRLSSSNQNRYSRS